MSKPQGTKIALIITLSILGLIVIGVIVVVIFAANFIRSEDGKKLTSTISNLAQSEKVAPMLSDVVMECNKTGIWPETLDDLIVNFDESSKRSAKGLFKYTKPDPKAPDSTIVLTTETWEMIEGITNKVEINKKGEAKAIQITPLRDKRAQSSPFGLVMPKFNQSSPVYLPEIAYSSNFLSHFAV